MFRRKSTVASVVVLGAVGSVLFGGAAFADDSHGRHHGNGGDGKPRGTAHATCVGPPLAVGVAVVGQNSGETTQCSVKKEPPPSDNDAGDGS